MERINEKKQSNTLSISYILRWFSPRWFIFIMGTGALATIFQLFAGKPAGVLHSIAVFFLMTALVVFPVAFFFMVLRFFVGLDCIMKEWRHSSLIQFYSAISIAAAICATGLLNIPVSFIPKGTAYTLAVVFWWTACVTGLFFIFLTPYNVITGITLNHAGLWDFGFFRQLGSLCWFFPGIFWACICIILDV
ncbi:MAG: hypothetical protein P9M03_06200 [Candidatus Theseobacter exili]|nr:hypothetical protein [Candidatus Theseobacter exili]